MCQVKRKYYMSKEFIINYQKKINNERIDWQGSEFFIPKKSFPIYDDEEMF